MLAGTPSDDVRGIAATGDGDVGIVVPYEWGRYLP